MKHLKTPLIIISSIALLTALMLAFLEPPGQPTREETAAQTQTDPADNHPSRSRANDTTDPVVRQLIKRIETASGNAQFQSAAQAVLEQSAGDRRLELMQRLLGRWASSDFNAALNFAAGLEKSQDRDRLLEYAVVASGETEFSGVIEWLGRQSPAGPERQELLAALYKGPADQVPGEALKHIDRLDDGDFKDNMVRKLVGRWAQTDTAGALTWLGSRIPLSDSQAKLHESLFDSLLDEDFSRAGELIRNMPVSDRKQQLARRYADSMAKDDIAESLSWARTLTDPESYKMALSAGYEAWLRREGDKTIILEELLSESDSDFRNHLINEVALDIAAADPATLGGVVDQLPAGAQTEVALKVVRFWKERAPDEAAAWVEGLEAGPAKDRAGAVMAEHYAREGNTGRVVSMLRTIDDTRLRDESVQGAAAQLYRQSPQQARELLDQMPFLSDDEKDSIYSGLAGS